MSGNVTINPLQTTNAQGSFQTTSVGTVQGTFYDNPAVRYALAGGVLATSETLPMWGGVGIYEDIPGASGGPASVLGSIVGRASALTGSKALAGFSVFNQAHAMIQSPQSPVPLAPSGGQVNFFRFGSGAQIAVACDPTLADLVGDPTNTQVSWDFVNQLLVPYIGTLTISSGTYVTGTGVVTLTMSAPIGFAPGDSIVVSGLTGTGTNLAQLNGTFTALAGTTGSTVVYNAGAGLGSITITGGSLTLGSGSDVALPVKVLDILIGNSMTVSYDPTTGFATWNRTGATAIILI